MSLRVLRGFTIGCGVALAFLSTPPESKAIFHWLKSCCGCAPAVPVAAVPSCNPCAQTVAYVPQTCYRAQCVSVPVTTYRPVCGCSPCGGMTTTMMPVTTYRAQLQMVPYTTYRLVYCGAPTCAAPAAATTYYAPAPVAPAVAAPSCCSPTSYAAPATTTYSAPAAAAIPSYSAPAYSPPAPATTYPAPPAYNGGGTPTYNNGASPTPAPSPAPAPSAASGSDKPRTYADENNNNGSSNNGTSNNGSTDQQRDQSPQDSQPRLKPIPDDEPNRPNEPTSSGPRFIPPDSRTTGHPDDNSWAFHPVAAAAKTVAARPLGSAPRDAAASRAIPRADDGGWRPAR